MPKKLDVIMQHRLRELRLARGLSLEAVALEVGASVAQLSRLELGQRELTLDWMCRMADYYGIAPSDVLLAEHGGLALDERRLIDTMRQVELPQRVMFHALADCQQAFRQMPGMVDHQQQRPPAPI